MLRIILATLLGSTISAAGLAASPGSASDALQTPDQILQSAVHQAIGAPARVDIEDQATERLSGDMVLVPREPSERMMAVFNRQPPPGLIGMLLGAEGMETAGIIRFVRAGFVDADVALAWTAADMLASLNDAVERGNAERVKQQLQPLEARRWVQPPRYDPSAHQLTWAALIVPKSAPREVDGAITYHAASFGREGYVELTVDTSVEKAEDVGHLADDFLSGLNFRAGKAYGDVVASDRRAASGLGGVMGIEAFHRAPGGPGFWASDRVVPIAGGGVAVIGALSLFIYVQRHLRREARRG